ncbi:MAG: helix-turn-helix domain-containing protein, partial [Xanthomonadaceae bacterium]|nr:helix-turn-helix domain-containing protein [Xanthomonadaceae bacterium]
MTDVPTLERAYRVRLSPKPAQARVLSRLFGARRWVW